MLVKSPSVVLRLAVALAMLFTLLALLLVLRVPWLGLVLRADYVLEQVVVNNSSLPFPSDIAEPLVLTSLHTEATGTLNLLLDDLVEEPDLLGSNTRIADFFARQTRLHAVLLEPEVELTFADAAGVQYQFTTQASQRPLGSLPLSFWVQVVVACASFLTGCWIWALRQTDWGPRCFLVSGVGIMLAAMSAAIYSSRELALDGALFKALSAINFFGAALFGAAMVGLFLSYPKPLLRPRWMLAVTALLWGFALVHVMERYALIPYLFPNTYMPPQIIIAEMTGIIIVAAAQWFATRGDPASRAVLRWLGVSIIICSGLFIALFYIPVILQEPLVISQGYAFVFFLLIYLGIALGLRRYRLFDLGTWAFRIIFYLSALLGFMLLDALIISLLQLSADISTGIALLVVGFGYLPLRDWLWRLTLGRTRVLEENLFMEAMDIPFNTEPNAANQKWQLLLREVFDPLQILENDSQRGTPTLLEEGVELWLPATASVASVSLKFCQGGKRLFSSADLHFARQLLRLLEHAEKSRDAYEQGRVQERQRIAQDLHDDIGARLLTSLHSDDLGSTRSNIRKTIADLRTVVGGLVGTQTRLSVLISTLRFETGTRLEEVGIELDWPIDALEESTLLVDYRFTKNVSSILREIVSNVLVHAKATQVRIDTGVDATSLLLTVTDNGIGLTDAAHHGNGLNNIRTRTAALNGTMALHNETTGLQVRLEFPLNQDRRA